MVREAGLKDMDCLWEWCREQSYEEFCLWGAEFVYGYSPDRMQMRRRLEEGMDGKLFVLEKEQNIAGFGELTKIAADKSSATLSRLILKSSDRKKGWGKEFVLEILNRARGLGLKKVELVVYKENCRARGCYEGCGFGIERELIRPEKPEAWIMSVQL